MHFNRVCTCHKRQIDVWPNLFSVNLYFNSNDQKLYKSFVLTKTIKIYKFFGFDQIQWNILVFKAVKVRFFMMFLAIK